MLPLKRYAQISESHCGPATLQMLLWGQKHRFSQAKITQAAQANSTVGRYGVRPDQLAKAIAHLTPNLCLWSKQQASFDDLDRLLHHYHQPVGVNWQNLFYPTLAEELEDDPYGDHGHYAVIVDLDHPRGQIDILDPFPNFGSRPRSFAYNWFKTRWWDRTSTSVRNRLTGRLYWIYTHNLIFILAPKTARFPRQLGMLPAPPLKHFILPLPTWKPPLRYFDPGSVKDFQNIQTILKHPQVLHWLIDADPMGLKQYQAWTKSQLPQSLLLAIDSPPDLVSRSVYGFLYFYWYQDEHRRLIRLYQRYPKLKLPLSALKLELSFARHRPNNFRSRLPGHMTRSLALACHTLKRHVRTAIHQPTAIIAYIDPANLPAQRTVLSAGFKPIGSLPYTPTSLHPDHVFLWQ